MKRLIFVGLLACNAAHAEYKDGNALLFDINADTYMAQGVALGYIMGVADVGNGVTHCAPGNVTSGQMRDTIKKWLLEYPQYRHLMADVIVSGVLKNTWPCPKKGAGT